MAAAGGTVPVGDVEEDASQLLFPKGLCTPARLCSVTNVCLQCLHGYSVNDVLKSFRCYISMFAFLITLRVISCFCNFLSGLLVQ